MSLLPFLIFVLTLLFIGLLRPIAFRIGLSDFPQEQRRIHEQPTPLVGGIALFLAWSLGLLCLPAVPAEVGALWTGALLLLVVGVLDDRWEISHHFRFLAQIAACLLMALKAGVVLWDLGDLLPDGRTLSLGAFALLFTLFSAVGVINAINLSDGIDGLAAVLVLIALGSFWILAQSAGAGSWASLVSLLMAALLGFLCWNLPPKGRALAFLGDGGSLFLGFILVWLLIQGSQGETRLFAPVTALWLVALPLNDTVAVMSQRLLAGQSPFRADRTHCHHLLLAAGCSPRQTLGILTLAALLAAATGLLGHFLRWSDPWMLASFLILFAGHLGIRAWLQKFSRG